MTDIGRAETKSPQRISSPPPAGQKPWLKWFLALVVVVGIVGWFMWRNFGANAPPTDLDRLAAGGMPISIRDTEAIRGNIPIYVDALGTVNSLVSVTVSPETSGYLQEIAFKEGQYVRAGDFLAQIDPRPYQVLLEQYEATFEKDSQTYKQAQSALTRYLTMGKQGTVSAQTVVDQGFTVAEDKAQLDVDQANIDSVKLNLTYCHIVSPVDGLVGLSLVDAGNYVTAGSGSGLVMVNKTQPISVRFAVPEDNLPQILERLKRNALSAEAYDRSNVKLLATGTMSAFDNQIQTSTGTITLRALFDNKNNELFPNQFVNIHLLVDTLTDAIIVPNQAIQIGANGSNFAFVVKDDNTITVRNVSTGPSDTSYTSIISGLNVGEKVATDGTDQLREGAKVAPRRDPKFGPRTVPSSDTIGPRPKPDSSNNQGADITPSGGGTQ